MKKKCKVIKQGWMCPCCGNIYSPEVKVCTCSLKKQNENTAIEEYKKYRERKEELPIYPNGPWNTPTYPSVTYLCYQYL